MAFGKVTYQNVSIKYGIFVGIAHIIYFLIMRLFGLQDIVELSFLSSIFLIGGICLAIMAFKRAKNGEIDYFQGLAIGATVGVVSSTILALFLVLYLNIFDSSYLANLQASSLFPRSLSILSLFVLTIIYGSIPGFIIAFVAMQWFKRPDHTMAKRI
ncbi:DUF4199 domain-containing protein [Pontibacter vulgaris]|uniref:DUF4199 domain-containing protein n=1 Tax=Pontibacter vulgaris TaxID=2905679 RepID=UPI001FA76C71|nr:DUF4199 domain-containing protein [Pontibacter vulgaris]